MEPINFPQWWMCKFRACSGGRIPSAIGATCKSSVLSLWPRSDHGAIPGRSTRALVAFLRMLSAAISCLTVGWGQSGMSQVS